MRAWIIAIGLMVSLVGGCSFGKKEESVSGLSGKTAQEMEAERSPFERSEDPPFSADTRFAAGRLAETQGALPQAIAQYQEAIKLQPQHQGAWYRLGVLYAKTKQFPQAIDAWEHYVKATNGAAGAYSNLGFCFEVSGDRPQAEAAYRKGIERDPKNVPCRVNYGLMLARDGREPAALEQLTAVLSEAEAHYNLGSVYEQLGKKEQAKAQYSKALELNPNLWEAKTRMAQMK